MKPTTLVVENARLENRCSGSTGSGGAARDAEEDAQEHDSADGQGDHPRRAPWIGGATEAREQHERAGRGDQQARSKVVDDVVNTAEPARNLDLDHGERRGADRQVDIEDPVPGELLDEDAAEQRADDAR